MRSKNVLFVMSFAVAMAMAMPIAALANEEIETPEALGLAAGENASQSLAGNADESGGEVSLDGGIFDVGGESGSTEEPGRAVLTSDTETDSLEVGKENPDFAGETASDYAAHVVSDRSEDREAGETDSPVSANGESSIADISSEPDASANTPAREQAVKVALPKTEPVVVSTQAVSTSTSSAPALKTQETTASKPANATTSSTTAKTQTTAKSSPAKPVHAAEALGFVNGHVYVFGSANSGNSLQVAGKSVNQGSTVRNLAQQWLLTFVENGLVTLKNLSSKKLLDVSGAKAANGADVITWQSNNGKNQKWYFEKNADGSFSIVSALSTAKQKLVLDVSGASKKSGANVIVWKRNGGKNQGWKATDATKVWNTLDAQAKAAKGTIASGDYVLVTGTNRSNVVDVTGNSTKAGANVETWAFNNGANQKWRITIGQDGYATIKSLRSGKLLDVSGASAASGANVIQWDANGGRNQKWIVSSNGDGTLRIQSALWTGLSLNIAGNSGKGGANITVAGSSSANGQKLKAYSLSPKVAGSAVNAAAPLASGHYYSLRSALNTGYYLDVTGCNSANGTKMELWTGNTSVAQRFRLVKSGEYYRLETGAGAGAYVGVDAGKVVPGSKAEVRNATSNATLFSLQYDAKTKGYRLVNKASGLALQPTSGKASQGAAVTGEVPHAGSVAQTFVFVEQPGLINDGIYSISTLLAGGRAASVKSSALNSGAGVVINTYLKGTNQKWKIAAVSGKPNTYTIENICSGMRLQGANNAAVTVRSAATSDLQNWIPQYSKGAWVLVNASTKKALDVSGESGKDGTALCNWTKKGGAPANQRFKLTSVPALDSGVYEILLASNNGLALDVQGNSLSAGGNIELYKRQGAANQKFYYDASTGILRALSSGLVLDVSGASTASGANVAQWNQKTSGNANQKWTASYLGGGQFKLASGLGKNLVLSAAAASSGANVTDSTNAGAATQKWRMVHSANIEPIGFNLINSIVSKGHGSLNASYIVIHETANPGATAKNHRDYWKANDTYAVHYTVDWTGNCYYCVPEDRLCWQVGNGNKYVVGIELCHATNKSDFNKVWNYGVNWAAWQLAKNGWGTDRLISHYDCTKKWGGSDHTDPIGYFKQYGKTWAQFKSDVAKALANR